MMSKHAKAKTDQMVLSLLILLTGLLWGGAAVALMQQMLVTQTTIPYQKDNISY